MTRAEGRIRTAAYRNGLDRRNCPTTSQIGMAIVLALVTSTLHDLTDADRGILGRALVDLNARRIRPEGGKGHAAPPAESPG